MKLKLFFAKLKDKWHSSKKLPIILTGIIVLFVIGGIAALIATIYLTGSDLGTWMSKYYPWFVVGFAVVVIVVFFIIFSKLRKGK